ncbi:uncharacterized protein LOC132943960 [Metopolophium dirhodum]|uniref:uncharacterized protein LOC132943960 n=1 Tax=Metopolophium dirhodum TaxID=44670 RepID=UPI00298F7380|nr:uncharacterized protein LOC132943960 [Metopolophium dirhodum]
MLPTFHIKETGGYIYEFYQYLVNLRKQPTDRYQIVNPNDSQIGIQVGYLRNWCGVQGKRIFYSSASYKILYQFKFIKLSIFIKKFFFSLSYKKNIADHENYYIL